MLGKGRSLMECQAGVSFKDNISKRYTEYQRGAKNVLKQIFFLGMCLSPPYLCVQKTEGFLSFQDLALSLNRSNGTESFFLLTILGSTRSCKIIVSGSILPAYTQEKKHLDDAGTEPRSSCTTSNHSIHNTIGPGQFTKLSSN